MLAAGDCIEGPERGPRAFWRVRGRGYRRDTEASAGEFANATRSSLKPKRKRLVEAWQTYVLSNRDAHTEHSRPAGIRPEIVTSRERSADRVSLDVSAAPVDDPADTAAAWEATPRRTAGTNALDLALRLDGAATVYSAEHFNSCVHDWTCWAAPIHDPATGQQLGVLDLSTTWDRAHPMGGPMAIAFARLLEQALPVRKSRARPSALPRRPFSCACWAGRRRASTAYGCC
jgi:hypothetical protein